MRRFYTTYETAHLLGVSLPTVVNWINARRLKAHRTPGGHRRISREDLASFMARHAIPVPPELADAVQDRRRALFVGVDGLPREQGARELAAAGYDVESAPSDFMAGLAIARFRPDVLILHPIQADGGPLLAGVRTAPETQALPVIGVAPPEWAQRLSASGCTGVVTLPLVESRLATAVGQSFQLAVASRR